MAVSEKHVIIEVKDVQMGRKGTQEYNNTTDPLDHTGRNDRLKLYLVLFGINSLIIFFPQSRVSMRKSE